MSEPFTMCAVGVLVVFVQLPRSKQLCSALKTDPIMVCVHACLCVCVWVGGYQQLLIWATAPPISMQTGLANIAVYVCTLIWA